MRKLNYFLLLTFLVGCSDPDTKPFDLEYLSFEMDYQSKNTILNEFMLPLRDYESKSEEVLHLEVARDHPLFFTTNFINFGYPHNHNSVSDKQIEHAFSNELFNCYLHPRRNRLAGIYMDSVPYVDGIASLKVRDRISIHTACGMDKYEKDAYGNDDKSKRTEASIKYPTVARSKIIVLLPSNPLDEVIPLLNQMGYSPFNQWDRESTDKVNKRRNFNEKRDTYDLGFINEDQSGIFFFWNDKEEITNISFRIEKEEHFGLDYYDSPWRIDNIEDLKNISEIISKLISVKQDVVFSSLFCRFYSSHKDIKQEINCNDVDINKIGKYFLKKTLETSGVATSKRYEEGKRMVSIYLK